MLHQNNNSLPQVLATTPKRPEREMQSTVNSLRLIGPEERNEEPVEQFITLPIRR